MVANQHTALTGTTWPREWDRGGEIDGGNGVRGEGGEVEKDQYYILHIIYNSKQPHNKISDRA